MKTLGFSSLALAAFLMFVGCDSKSVTTEKKSVPTEKPPAAPATEKKEDAKSGEGHDWWCDEHGVKEAECSMCSAKVAKERKRNGDWCEDHQRAKSQCFLCEPKLEAKFAAEYVAKNGKQPPEPTGQRPEKK